MKSQSQPRNTRKLILDLRKQAGMTLMEIIAALAIIAAVVVGALSLFNSASSSNQAVTMVKSVIAVRAAVQQLYLGQGGYVGPAAGAANSINAILNTTGKAPSDLAFRADGTYTTSWGGTLSVTGYPAAVPASANFSITLTAVPPDICSQVVTNASNGWSTVAVGPGAAPPVIATVGAAAGAGFPITPVVANGACGVAGGTATIVFTTVN